VATLTALAAIHRAGVVHRDFKPSNVIMGPEGPVVIDFGIARTLDQTVTSTVIGTPAFMAPEQFAGGAIGPEADLFSWAGTMVFAATGRSAFTGDTTPAQMRAILDADPDLTGVPAALRSVLEKCLVKDPRQRPTADEVLRWLTGEPGGAQATTVRVASRYPAFEPPKTRLLEEDGLTQVDRAPDTDRRPNAPLAIAAAAVMTIAGLLGIATIAGKAALSSASYGGFFLSIALLGVAVWRSHTAARVALCLTVPCGLVFAYWVTLEDWSFPNVLLSVVPLSLAGVSTVLAAALLRRASMTAIAFGVTTGALLVFSQVLVLGTSLITVELSEAFLVFWRVVDATGCVSSSAWTILLGVAAARRAQA
jgi:hypothetical protein